MTAGGGLDPKGSVAEQGARNVNGVYGAGRGPGEGEPVDPPSHGLHNS